MWKQIQNVNKDKLWIKSMIWFDKYWGCHQLPERSFFFKGYQLPICARCLGIILGYILCIFLLIFNCKLNIYLLFLLILTTLIDWSLQFFNILSSNNIRRLVTGILGGIGLMGIYVYIVIKLFDLFKNILQSEKTIINII